MHFIMVTWLMVLINQGLSTIAAPLWKTNCPWMDLLSLLLMEVAFTNAQTHLHGEDGKNKAHADETERRIFASQYEVEGDEKKSLVLNIN